MIGFNWLNKASQAASSGMMSREIVSYKFIYASEVAYCLHHQGSFWPADLRGCSLSVIHYDDSCCFSTTIIIYLITTSLGNNCLQPWDVVCMKEDIKQDFSTEWRNYLHKHTRPICNSFHQTRFAIIFSLNAIYWAYVWSLHYEFQVAHVENARKNYVWS